MSQQRSNMTPLQVMPLVATYVREKMVRGIVLPFSLPKKEDVFTEIVRYEKHYRIYFNKYQLGFDFRLQNTVGLKEYIEKDKPQEHNVDPNDPAAFAKLYPRIWIDVNDFELYTIWDISVIRREQVAQRVGCSENEVNDLFPLLRDCAYCLFIDLTKPTD